MLSIALVVPYFGKLPNYFSSWLMSCRFNPTVDWYIFTDDRKNYDYPENVHVIYTSFEEVKNRFQRCFDFNISIPGPYKLTDFKPTYGLVFAEYLKGYDFWGFGDIDLIYGNIRQFLTDDILVNHDKILCHGHLVLLRNTHMINTLFKNEINGKLRYKEVYKGRKYRGFDEYGDEAFHTICINSDINIYVNNLIFADLNSWKRHFALTSVYRVLLDEEKEQAEWEKLNDNSCTIFSFNQGRLTRLFIDSGRLCERDYLYVHMQKRKMTVELGDEKSSQFMIVPNKFIDFIHPCELDTVKHLGRKRLISSRRWRRQIRVYCRNRIKKWFGI